MSAISKSPWIIHYDGSSCNGCDIEVLATLPSIAASVSTLVVKDLLLYPLNPTSLQEQ